MHASRPIDDIRGSAAYRREMVRVCTLRGLRSVARWTGTGRVPGDPILLWGKKTWKIDIVERQVRHPEQRHRNNHQRKEIHLHTADMTRPCCVFCAKKGMLIGTKEGCAEGECGACTVFLDGKAVMACLVPRRVRTRAIVTWKGWQIVTVEGLC